MATTVNVQGADRVSRSDPRKSVQGTTHETATSNDSEFNCEFKSHRVEALLTELLGVQRRILTALEQQQAVSWTPADAERFLATVARVQQGCAFTTKMLFERATVDLELQELVESLTCRQLGARLRTLAGRWVGSYRVKAIKREDSGTLWVVYVRDLHTDARAADEESGR